jgi:hypothetical protein
MKELMMNKKVMAGIAAGLLTVAALLTVGIVAYNAGERSDRSVEVVGEVVADGESATRMVLVPADGHWHGGWRGPGWGFLLFPLIVIGLALLFASRRGGWRGPHQYTDEELRAWHHRQHGDEVSGPAAPGT